MKKSIKINGYVNDSIVDGPGLRFSIFTQGCIHKCPGCHNPETWDINKGYYANMDDLVLMWRQNPLLQGITLSGGDPFLQPDKMLYLIKKAKETNLDVVIYTGYTYEELIKKNNKIINEILSLSDYLIDGKFILSLYSENCLYRGSTNQRIILLQKTKKENKIITAEEI